MFVSLRELFLFVSKHASGTVEANLFFVELGAISSLVVIILSCLCLSQPVTLIEFLLTVSIEAVLSKFAVSCLQQILTESTLEPLTTFSLQKLNFEGVFLFRLLFN